MERPSAIITDSERAMEYNVISADDHILEPRELFVERLPREFRDRAPRVLRGEDGGDGWSWDGRTVERTLGIEATAGRAPRASGYKWEEILPGNYDGAEHIKDLDRAGIDAAVLFPSVPVRAWSMDDDPFGLALIRTFNDWLFDEFCAADPRRLIGLPMMPVNDTMEVLLGELGRVLKKGAKAVHIPVFPNRSYVDTWYDPFWKAVTEADVPLCMHRTSGGKDTAGWGDFSYKVPGLNVAGSVVRFFSGVQPLTVMTFSGLFQRFPTLKIMDAEVNFGWIPFWKQTMDENFEKQKGWANFPFDHMPSDVIGKNVFVSVLDDYLGFGMIESKPYLADTALFSTDYPHSFCLWPDTGRFIEEAAAICDPVSKDKILAGNAVRIFNLN